MTLPQMPGHTCPLIDKVIEFITDAEAYTEDNDFGSTKIEDLQGLYDHIASEGYGIKAVLEEIREANGDLRAIAQHYEEANENHEAVVEDLQNQIEELKREIRLLT